MRDGLPQQTVQCIAQTRDGYLWIGTEDGLARFDGTQFRTYDTSTTPGLVVDDIQSLLEDAGGSLWIAGQGGLTVMHNGVFRKATPPGAGMMVLDCQLDPERRFWVRSGSTLYRGDAGLLVPGGRIPGGARAWCVDSSGAAWVVDSGGALHCPDGKTLLSQVRSVASDADQHVWVGAGNGVDVVRNGSVQNVAPASAVGANPDVCVDGHGDVWVLGAGRLFRYSAGQFRPEEDWSGINIGSISVNSAGDLICRYDGSSRATDKLAICVNHTFVDVDAGQRIKGNLLACLRDSQGDIWIGSDTGLTGIRDRECQTFDMSSGLADARITSALVDFGWHVLVAEDDGGLYRYSGDTDRRFQLLLHNAKPLHSLVETSDGLYLCIVDGAVFEVDGVSGGGKAPVLRPYLPARSLEFGLGPARSLNVGAQGDLWVTGRNRVAQLGRGGVHWFNLPNPADTPATYVDHMDGLWVSTNQGLCRIAGSVAQFNVTNAPIDAFFEDSKEDLWIGTRGGGLLRYSGGQFVTITRHDGLPSNIVSQILEDDSGNLWFGCPREIYRIGVNELNAYADRHAPFQAYSYGPADGNLGGSTLPGIQVAGAHGWVASIWFPGQFGMVRIEPWESSTSPRPLELDRVVLNGYTVPASTAATVAPGSGGAFLGFASLDLKDPEHLQFSYRLDGFDREWIDAGQMRAAIYTNLPPGTYRFDIRCVNVDAGWTATRSFDFTLRPHLYQTWEFKVVVVLLAVGIVLFCATVRMRTLHARNCVLEELHARLEAQNEHLAANHEELEAQHQALMDLQAELEAQNAELIDHKATLETANHQLRQLATTDGLTGLWNHRTFQEALKKHWTEARAGHEPLSLLLIDVDEFKAYNDRFGHQSGDHVLTLVGALLRGIARDSDIVARYGGEEFAVILPKTDRLSAGQAAERFRHAVEELHLEHSRVTVSIGVAGLTPSMSSGGDLVQAADIALYASKRHGRNRVTHAGTGDDGLTGFAGERRAA